MQIGIGKGCHPLILKAKQANTINKFQIGGHFREELPPEFKSNPTFLHPYTTLRIL
jgi:hypothetical protein